MDLREKLIASILPDDPGADERLLRAKGEIENWLEGADADELEKWGRRLERAGGARWLRAAGWVIFGISALWWLISVAGLLSAADTAVRLMRPGGLWENAQREEPARNPEAWRGDVVELAEAMRQTHGGPIPEEIMEEAERLDPENGYFALLEAMSRIGKAVEKGSDAWGERVYTIKNEAEARAIFKQVQEGLAMPSQRGYREEIFKKRVAEAGRSGTWLRDELRVLAAKAQCASDGLGFYKLADLWSALTQEAIKTGDAQMFQDVLVQWRKVVDLHLSHARSALDVLIAQSLMERAEAWREQGAKLGWLIEQEKYQHLAEALHELRQQRQSEAADTAALVQKHGSAYDFALTSAISGVGLPAEILSDELLKPGRVFDHLRVENLLCLAGWALLAAAAGVALGVSAWRGWPFRQMACRGARMLEPSDWASVMIAGVGLPLALYGWLTRVAFFSTWDYGLGWLFGAATAAQFAALLLAMIGVSLALAEWRVRHRLRSLKQGKKPRGVAWLAALVCLALLPLTALINEHPTRGFAIFLTSLALLPLSWLLFWLWRLMRGSFADGFVRGVVVHLWLPALLGGAVALMCLPLLNRPWIKQLEAKPTVLPIPDGWHALSGYEGIAAKSYHAALMREWERFKTP